MAAVIQDQAMFRVDGVQEIAAEAHRDPDNATQRAWGRIIRDVGGLQWHDPEVTQVVRGRHKHKRVLLFARPFQRGLRRIAWEAEPEYLLLGRRRAEFVLQMTDVR